MKKELYSLLPSPVLCQECFVKKYGRLPEYYEISSTGREKEVCQNEMCGKHCEVCEEHRLKFDKRFDRK